MSHDPLTRAMVYLAVACSILALAAIAAAFTTPERKQ